MERDIMLEVKDLHVYYDNIHALKGISLKVGKGEVVSLIGANGAGKTTTLQTISGLIQAREGSVIFEGQDITKIECHKICKMGIAQVPEGRRVFARLPVKDNLKLGAFTVDDTPENLEKDRARFYEVFPRMAERKNQLAGTLSGGEQQMLAMGRALMSRPKLLILDEPTNHLDNGMIEYLEKFLIKWSKGLLMVTHDRYFLERVVNRIIEIDHGQIYKYEANYSKYLELKQARLETQLSSQRKRKLFLKKELEWVRAGVQARTTKSKDRLQRFEELSKVKDVEVNGKVEMIHTFSRLGKKTIELHEISKSFEQKKLFDEFSYMFKQHDRIGILGDNGTGKSTLLNIITGNLKSDMGYVEIGETVRFGYFKQGYDDLPMNKKVIDYIQEISNDFKVDGQGLSAKDMLERFLFDARLQYTPISRLSGGERRRLYLLRVLMMMPNVLVLDEPTNDLDIDTLNILEDYLDNFEGIIMTVSHDRYFLDRICDGLFILQNQHLRYVNGGYSQNLDTTTKEEKEKSQGALAYKQSKQKKIKMTYMEKKEFEEIEDIIMDLETNLSQIEEKMNGVTDFKEIDKLSKQRDDLQKQIDEKNERYLYLLELQEQIDNQ